MTRIALDLTQSHFIKERGDLTLYGSWYGEQRRPCLAVLPTNREGIPLVIELKDAWKWNPDDKDVPGLLIIPGRESQPESSARLIGAFLYANGYDSNSITAMRVLSLIHDHLGDLLAMPPKPTTLQVVADAFRTDENGKVHHQEIREHV